MRFIFLLLLVAGIGLGIAYPWYMQNFTGSEIGSWSVYERGSDFRPVTVNLSAADAPVRVLVDMTARVKVQALVPGETDLTITAATDGRTVLAETMTFAGTPPVQDSPQSGDLIYRATAGMIDPVESGGYRFVLGRGDSESVRIERVELILKANAVSYDERAQPVGYALMAIGFVGFVLAVARRGRRSQTDQSGKPVRRWGRGGN